MNLKNQILKKNYTNDEWSRIQQREQMAIKLDLRVQSMKKAIEHGEKSIRYYTELIQALKKKTGAFNKAFNNFTRDYLNTRGING